VSAEAGQRIRLTLMPEDPDPIPVGATGVVSRVGPGLYGRQQVWVDWDPPNDRRSLMLIDGVDRWEVLREGGPRVTVYEYRTADNERVHLTRQEDDRLTLCGHPTASMALGDETMWGGAATCGSCRRVAKLPKLVDR
jgi:hypothetical protein